MFCLQKDSEKSYTLGRNPAQIRTLLLGQNCAYGYTGNNMAKPKTPAIPSHIGGRVALLLFFLLLLYVVVPRIDNLSASLDSLRDANFGYIALACVVVAATYGLAALTYWLVALKPRLNYRRTLAIQTASAFANRLLPAGLGGLTLSVQYLRKEGYTTAQAAAVAGVNNLLGGAGHFLLLCVVLLSNPGASAASLKLPEVPHGWLILIILISIVAVLLIAFKTLRQLVLKATGQISRYIVSYRKHPGRLAGGLLSSLLVTTCYALVLYVSALSLGAELSMPQVFVVFTVGVAAATVTPTPGGLVGAEAGLTAGLITYGIEGSLALAIALLYRFLTYWLPLLPGFVVFVLVRRLYL